MFKMVARIFRARQNAVLFFELVALNMWSDLCNKILSFRYTTKTDLKVKSTVGISSDGEISQNKRLGFKKRSTDETSLRQMRFRGAKGIICAGRVSKCSLSKKYE